MKAERYLNIFSTPSELGSNIKKIIITKLIEKYLHRKIDGKMITDIHINQFNNLPLSNNLERNIPAKVTYKIYKPGDIINGELISSDRDDRVFLLSYDIICEILNVDFIKTKNKKNDNVRLSNIKSTNGCIYFLAQGEVVGK